MKKILSGRPSYYLVYMDRWDGTSIIVGYHAYKWQARIDIRRRMGTSNRNHYYIRPVYDVD